jgi:hypothetical protein
MVKKTAVYVVESYIDFIIPALGLVTALAWDSAFKKLFEENEEIKKYGPWVYAIVLTMIILIIISILKSIKRTI